MALSEDRELSDVGKYLIQEIIERKAEEIRAEKILNRWSYTAIICLVVGGGYFLLNFYYSYSFIHVLANDIFMFCIIALFGISLLQVKLAKDKLEKAEEDYDNLRAEMIERSEEIWNTEQLLKDRDYVYELLKKNYDVNLYHK